MATKILTQKGIKMKTLLLTSIFLLISCSSNSGNDNAPTILKKWKLVNAVSENGDDITATALFKSFLFNEDGT